MKKILTIAVFSFAFFTAGELSAQTTDKNAKTQQVIGGIPALKSIQSEINSFESKIAVKKEDYRHADADLRALKTKYANELASQIGLNENNEEVRGVLQAELNRVQEELKTLTK